MIYESPPVGHEISAVFHGVSEEIINDSGLLKKIVSQALKEDNFGILRENHHDFEPQGYTGMWLLSESHAAMHTYPEHKSIYFQIYSCRGERDGINTFEYLKKMLNAESVEAFERPIRVKEEEEESPKKERGWL
jgi:S-adenosylmethionine decarboxylase